MNEQQPNNNEREDQRGDGKAGRAPSAPRRVSGYPLPLPPGVLTDTQTNLVCDVIALVEAADRAEAMRARRRPPSEFDACRAPAFGSDVSDYAPTPETLEAQKFIDSQSPANREMLLAVMNGGRDRIHMTPSKVEWLLRHASSGETQLGSYMLSKTNCAVWLKEGLRKFERYTARMIRRGVP